MLPHILFLFSKSVTTPPWLQSSPAPPLSTGTKDARRAAVRRWQVYDELCESRASS